MNQHPSRICSDDDAGDDPNQRQSGGSWLVVMRYAHQVKGSIVKAGLSEAIAKHYASRCSCHEWIVEAMSREQYLGVTA